MFIIIIALPLIPYLIFHCGFFKKFPMIKKASFLDAIEFLVIVFSLCHFVILITGNNTNSFLLLGHSVSYTLKYIFLELVISGGFIFLDVEMQKYAKDQIILKFQEVLLPVVSILIGITIFCAIYGVKILDPTYTDWLMAGGDLSQHYLGWCFFRDADWQFPIGLFDTLSYPSSCSIIYTDSIPIFAVIFKLLSPILPSNFQYFGLWGVMSFALQCLLGTVIVKKYTKKDYTALIGGTLITLSPAVIYWMFRHTALAGQWIILLSWLPLIYPEKFKSTARRVLFWLGIGILCGSTHLYYIPMCGISVLAYVVKELVENKDFKSVLSGCSFVVGGLMTIFVLGGFGSGTNYEMEGFGTYNANLNTFFDTEGQATLLNNLGYYGSGQYEGFGYLGAGVIVLSIISITFFLQFAVTDFECAKKYIYKGIPFIIIFGVSFLLAIIPNIAIGDTLLFTIELPGPLLSVMSIFRANGRFIWSCVYVIVIVSVIASACLLNKKILPYILMACLLIQIGDLSGWLSNKYEEFSNEKIYTSLLKDDEWSEIAKEGFKHVYISPAISYDTTKLYSIAKWANENNMTLNRFYFARIVEGTSENYEKALSDPQNTDLFIFTESDYDDYIKLDNLYYVDDFIIGTNVDLNLEKIDLTKLTLSR